MFGIASVSSHCKLFKPINAEKSMSDIILDSVDEFNGSLAAAA